MRGLFLALALALTPLPNLPWIPSGSEIRIVSADLLTVYVVWQVNDRDMILQSKVPAPVGREVRVLFKVGDGYRPPYNGTTTLRGDVSLQIEGERVSLNELLTRTYRLNLPNGRVLPEVR
ncbi:hypothetical protein [Meiothermus granaticius]|jgi:hypothetical protein|uniref:Uncharacterized protein n=1 Tax=Meiothermus granaticius NBRC 107808 TaxID=1227551 RepID=A0A399FER2_9DEIN|nr:hypothetical protein [Meiothermus granaticius]MCL6527803.1 hypothetical protein [Thermaceae bacterium]RIH94049.1 hypothetical protein Mgrana_00138 [Meiothermus granaticius NBRC 107808]GEM88307.1 hypothetical protein MGR01S_29320 [Meiothermus granaticius NBRC 107808]